MPDNQSISVEGHLGQLELVHAKSDANRLYFEFNSNITDNNAIDEKFFVKKLVIIVDNNEIAAKDDLMQTEFEIKAFVKEEEDCEESNSEFSSEIITGFHFQGL